MKLKLSRKEYLEQIENTYTLYKPKIMREDKNITCERYSMSYPKGALQYYLIKP